MSLRIAGGTVYDPSNGIAGEVRDICIDQGRIVAAIPEHARTIDARGMIVMPGGVDIHSHVAGSSVNLARRLLPEEHDGDPAYAPDLHAGELPGRSGSGGTARRYGAARGAVAPSAASAAILRAENTVWPCPALAAAGAAWRAAGAGGGGAGR